MKLIFKNKEKKDCVIVAAYNALKAIKKRPNYKNMRSISLGLGWYNPKVGFLTRDIERFFIKFNVPFKEVPKGSTTKTVSAKIKEGVPHILFCRFANKKTGHAMLAIKGKTGVKVINAGKRLKGWRTISKLLKEKKIVAIAYEIG